MLDAAITALLRRESCFWTNEMMGPVWSLAQFRAGLAFEQAEGQAHLTAKLLP